MKILIIAFVTLSVLTSGHLTMAQLYAPELKIQNTNNRVGINTDNPQAQLHTVGSGLSWSGWFQNTNGADVKLGSKDGHGIYVNSVASGNLYLMSLNSGSSPRMSVWNDGRVAISSAIPDATFTVGRGSGNGGTAMFLGSQRITHFNYSTDEHTYIRGGKYSSNIYIGDYSGMEVGIGTSNLAGGYRLTVDGGAYVRNGSWQGSDRKLKKNIKKFDKGLAVVKEVNTVTYDYTADSTHEDSHRVGIIAQELQKLAPYLVRKIAFEDGSEELAIDPTGLTYLLINAVKEQQLEIEALREDIQSLRHKK